MSSLAMTLTKKSARNFAWNVLFATWVVVAVRLDSEWLTYPLIAFVWIMCILYASAYFSAPNKQIPSSLPQWFTRAFDIGILALFVYGSWYVTAVVYVASCVILEVVGKPKLIQGRP